MSNEIEVEMKEKKMVSAPFTCFQSVFAAVGVVLWDNEVIGIREASKEIAFLRHRCSTHALYRPKFHENILFKKYREIRFLGGF